MTRGGTYGFLPWLRNGIANTIVAADLDATIKTRVSVRVALRLSGEAVGGGAPLIQDFTQEIALYGPGDVVGIDSRAIVRTEPVNWNTNFESNYLAAIDFYDEDFPWRYTPATANTPDAGGSSLHLRPWLALIVLKESEFTDGQNRAARPSPYISVPDASVFPSSEELWAWAHVHFNQALGLDPTELVSADMVGVLPRVQAAIAANPDAAYSRLLCPRRLEENTGYHAFVVPVFETGRLAGLGQDPGLAPHATFGAWDPYASRFEADNFPVYFRWFFRTGSLGDFEYLVRLLKPQPVDPKVGTRDFDVQFPGSGLPGVTDSALGGVLRLGGALRVPDVGLSATELADRQKYEGWDQPYPVGFERDLASYVNLADDYAALDPQAANTATDIGPGVSDNPDPLITPPLYGRWHSLTQRLLTDRDQVAVPNSSNWVHRLNLDPGYRVPAGFGAAVVEQNAETYMNAAWEQIGDVLAANQRLRRLHFATAIGARWFDDQLLPLSAANPERAWQVAAPIAPRVVVRGATLASVQKASPLGSALTSTAFRRVVRDGARLIRNLPFDTNVIPTKLLARVNAGAVSAAPPKAAPAGVATVDQVGEVAQSVASVPPGVAILLTRFPALPQVTAAVSALIALVLIVALPGIGLAVAALVLVGGFYLFKLLRGWKPLVAVIAALDPAQQTPDIVDRLPLSPTFALSVPGAVVSPALGTSDSPTGAHFKTALREFFQLMQTSAVVDPTPIRTAIGLPELTKSAMRALDPRSTILKRGLASLAIPAEVSQGLVDPAGEVMAYPRIDLPMYLPLKDRSIELFLPNINLIAPNSITLVETNQRFVEAYMVGLNHEFARKLLWREYPTDQRGSYFRQFWDPTPYLDSAGLGPAILQEKLYDIPPLHTWPPSSALGTHNSHAPGGGAGEDAVLVIRGELLKKYPRAVIYAHRAVWQTKADGSIDPTLPRQLAVLTDAEDAAPPREKVRTPLYEAKADPDIYFFGFDLTIAAAKGGPGTSSGDDPGWFFVLKQRPGEPRFGLELTRDSDLEIFDQITWDDASGLPGQYLGAQALSSIALVAPDAGSDQDRQDQHHDDVMVGAAAVSAARWAYLLLRSPVMVAVHAAQMLGQGGA